MATIVHTEFVEECQDGNGGLISVTEVERIVEQVLHKRHRITSLINKKSFTLEDFHHYLFSSDLNPPIGSQIIIISFASRDVDEVEHVADIRAYKKLSRFEINCVSDSDVRDYISA
ncbi:hypothetical protein Tco_1049930 [Tanacetum coccineum]